MTRNAVPLTVAGVALDGEAEVPIVLLRNSAGIPALSVPVGAFEASAIILEIEGIHPPRPLTHDLLAEMFKRHKFRLDGFELYARDAESFLGRLWYHRGLRRYSMEVRPSDGIALALRLEAPITAADDLAEPAADPARELTAEFLLAKDVLYLESKVCSPRC
jgi:bifunctional DNase/RNase